MPAPDLRRDKPPTQPDMRPASYLPATASAPSLTAAARPEKTKFPGWLPSFRRLDANRHPMDLQFLVQASLPAHFPARHVRSRTKFENKRLLSSPIQSQGSKKTLIHPRYLKPEAGISFSHAIFATLSSDEFKKTAAAKKNLCGCRSNWRLEAKKSPVVPGK